MTFEQFIKEFLRITTDIKGTYFGAAHLITAAIVTVITVTLGILIGLKKKNSSFEDKLKVLRIATIVMLSVEVLHYVNSGIQSGDFLYIVKYDLPLFLCDILVFVMPLAAFTKGKLQKSCLQYVICLGILSMVMGAWFNAWMFNNNPIWSARVFWSFTNHCIPGFAALFIISSRMIDLKLKEIGYTFLILLPFAIVSLALDNIWDSTNYMFWNRSDGTPFFLFENLANGNLTLYRVLVAAGMALYITVYYVVWEICEAIGSKAKKKKELAK